MCMPIEEIKNMWPTKPDFLRRQLAMFTQDLKAKP